VLVKYVITFFFLTTLHAGAAAQLLHGTYFLAGITTEFAVVAIDSRESVAGVDNGTVSDRYCKIRTLSDRVVFFATGKTVATSARSGAIIFDAREIAQRSFEYFTGDNFDELANRWARQMIAFYASHADSVASVANEIVAEGLFIGTTSLNAIAGFRATIFRRPDRPEGFVYHGEKIVPGPPGNARLLNNGHFEILEELFGKHQSYRAKRIMAGTAGWPPGPDTDASRYTSYVAAIRDWSGDEGIGGEVATIILERGKNWRWFRRPDFCL
jgi:hypothetical protein